MGGPHARPAQDRWGGRSGYVRRAARIWRAYASAASTCIRATAFGCGREGGDILDLALKDKTATIESIEQDMEDRIHLAVVVDDDPGSDLWPPSSARSSFLLSARRGLAARRRGEAPVSAPRSWLPESATSSAVMMHSAWKSCGDSLGVPCRKGFA